VVVLASAADEVAFSFGCTVHSYSYLLTHTRVTYRYRIYVQT